MTLDEYCNSSASDRFHGDIEEEKEEPKTDDDFMYELARDIDGISD